MWSRNFLSVSILERTFLPTHVLHFVVLKFIIYTIFSSPCLCCSMVFRCFTIVNRDTCGTFVGWFFFFIVLLYPFTIHHSFWWMCVCVCVYATFDWVESTKNDLVCFHFGTITIEPQQHSGDDRPMKMKIEVKRSEREMDFEIHWNWFVNTWKIFRQWLRLCFPLMRKRKND